ncbi:unnamed protein product [Alopecurus aequalis]
MADAETQGAAAAVYLDDGIVSEILHRLPTKDAYRLAAACRRWRSLLALPTFLCHHLSPRPMPLLDDGPRAFVVQPRDKVGYTHLTVVATDPADRGVAVTLPVPDRYKDRRTPVPPPRPTVGIPRPDPVPALLETARDKSVLRLLYSEEEDDDVPDGSASEDDAAEQLVLCALFDDEDTEPPAEAVDPAATAMDAAEPDPVPWDERHYGDDAAEPLVLGSMFDDEDTEPSAEDVDPAATATEAAAPDPVPSEEHPAPAVSPPVEDYVIFFERTVPMLDICFVASHGRLLLARSRIRYYVCDPAANRWIVLPPSTIAPVSDANAGIHYEVDASTGKTAFTVVLLLRRRLRRGLVETFSSTTGVWDARELRAQGVARGLGAASPGVHFGSCFYWVNRRQGRVVIYDAVRDRASVLREPPLAEKAVSRLGRSLGSVDGTGIRLCAFDIRDEKSHSMMPHDDLEGVHGVWFLESAAAARPAWRRVHEAVVEDLSVWYFLAMCDSEKPVDFPGASGDFILLDQNSRLLRYDLESGRKVQLFSLYRDTSRLGALYSRFHAFPFFG